MEIRNALAGDLDALAELEAACFPEAEAATREQIGRRLASYPNHFHLLFEGGTLAAFTDGMASGERDLRDEMYENASLHDERGDWQMVFGVNTHPAFRHRGFATALLRRMIDDARSQGRRGLVLTCKPALAGFYARLGFRDEGESPSTHGNARWRQMRLEF